MDNTAARVMVGALLIAVIVVAVILATRCAQTPRKAGWESELRVYECGNLILERTDKGNE